MTHSITDTRRHHEKASFPTEKIDRPSKGSSFLRECISRVR